MLRYMILHHVGFPIRKSVGRSLFAAHHSLSQLVTSFFGSWCQGIHLTLLFAWTSCIFSYTLVLFELSEFLWTFSFRIFIDSFSLWKDFLFAFCTLFWVCAFARSTFRWNCIFPFRLERLIYLLRLFVLFCSFSTQKFFLLFDCQRSFAFALRMLVGLDGLEPSTSRLSGARSSHLSYKPEISLIGSMIRSSVADSFIGWWRWRESNPWPPACRAGALPAELHPHIGIASTVSMIHDLSVSDHWQLNNKKSCTRFQALVCASRNSSIGL